MRLRPFDVGAAARATRGSAQLSRAQGSERIFDVL